ncbi:hypothetical protein CMV_011848 [Castanea mollissima]|uniref:Uncharacterized protein n=1 Tax=Castanea mollissima TaxID=60419 RepID=A0A8J4VNF3_9ROSI|nr:hypothetical protein CMV_011848 [Castanea mollissima]
MRLGMEPKIAAKDAISRIARKFPDFVGAVFAINKNGVHAGACHGWTFQYSVRSPEMNDVEFLLFPLSSFSMASQLSLQLPQFFYYSKSVGLDNRGKAMANAPHSLNFKPKEQGTCVLSKKNYSRWFSSWMLLSMASSHSNQTNSENGVPVANHQSPELGFNRVNCLVWVLHESARSFSCAVESLQLSGTGPAIAMAWIGKDVHDWHKRIAYQLVPQGFFLPLLKNWSTEYAGSGVAGIIVALSCCTTVGKLCYRRTCCPLTLSIEDALIELMDLSHSLVPVDKLHQLVTEAGFEVDLLAHFGTKVFPSKRSEELEFWIGLAQKKLSVAFQKENMFLGRQIRYKVQADSFATLGIFAYLGKSTRMFLSRMGIKDLDEHVKDFLSYLECGSLFVYPELSSISVYQLFMEVVIDEIGWLDFYAAFSYICN